MKGTLFSSLEVRFPVFVSFRRKQESSKFNRFRVRIQNRCDAYRTFCGCIEYDFENVAAVRQHTYEADCTTKEDVPMKKKMLLLFVMVWPFFLSACGDNNLELKIRFDKVQGLKKGNRVMFEETHIGDVNRVVYTDQGDFLVDVSIVHDFVASATEYSRFTIISDPSKKEDKAIEMIHVREGGGLLKNKATVEGTTQSAILFQQIFEGIERGVRAFEDQVEQFSSDFKGIPESDEFKKLEDEFNRLTEGLKQSGQAARKKIETELLPQLRKEMETLRKQLDEFNRDENRKTQHDATAGAKKI